MAQCVKTLAAKLDSLTRSPTYTWWKEKADSSSCPLPSAHALWWHVGVQRIQRPFTSVSSLLVIVFLCPVKAELDAAFQHHQIAQLVTVDRKNDPKV